MLRCILILFAISVLISCSKDDPRPTSKIVGTWQITNSETKITAPGGNLRQYLISEFGMSGSEADAYVIYLQNGEAATLDIATIVFNNDASYSATGETGAKFEGKWEITAGNIVVILDKGTASETVVPVETLTDTDLTLLFDLSEQVNLADLKYELILSFGKN